MLNVLGHDAAMHFHHDGFEFSDAARPPHDFDLARRLARYSADAKLVYLDRDPRDVMVSLYHQVTGRFGDVFDYRGDISDFIRDDYFGACVLARFRDLWSSILARRPYLHVRYDDLHDDPAAVVRRVLRYQAWPADDERIAKAVEAGRLPNMRRVEQSGEFPEPWLRPRNGFPKVRRGEIGAFHHELSGPDIEHLNAVFGL
jgi:hypothetical protein